jgi:hypothetical protein
VQAAFNARESACHDADFVLDSGETIFHRAECALHATQSILDRCRSPFESIEALAHTIEALVHTIEALVHTIETLVDTMEAEFHCVFEAEDRRENRFAIFHVAVSSRLRVRLASP